MKKVTLIFGLLRVVLDFFGVALAYVIAREIRTHTDLIPGVQLPTGYIPPVPEYIPFVMAAAATFVLVFALNGAYSFKSNHKFRREFLQILFLSTAWIMLVFAFFFLRRDTFFSRLVLVYGWILATLLVTVFRIIIRSLQRYLQKKGIGVANILLVGGSSLSLTMYERFRINTAYNILGIVTPHKETGDLILGEVKELSHICRKNNVDEILQVTAHLGEHMTSEDVLDFCTTHHIRYRFIPDLVEVQRTNVEVWEEEGMPIIELKPTSLDGWGRITKRLFDILVGTLALIILLPIFMIIAIWIKLDSEGPVFFRQKRVGYHGQDFSLLKFRTMVKNAEEIKQKLLEKSERQGPLFKIKNDPRITRCGKFLRKWSLDELPQIWTVLEGKMSLVGPRPHLPMEVEKYEQHHKILLTIKPGITGMAQVNGRSGLAFEDEVRFDLYYIQNWSLWLDIIIMFKTVAVVLRRENAD